MVAKIEEWAALYGQQGIFEINLFGIRYIALCSEEYASLIENQRPYKVTRILNLNRAVKSIGADGVFSAEGDMWRKDRRMVGPALNRKNVRDYVATVKLVGARLVEKWSPMMDTNGNAIAINSDILSSTVDIIALVAFSKDIDSLRRGQSTMGDDLLTTFKSAQLRVFSPFPYWDIPIVGQYLDGAGWAVNRLRRSLTALVDQYESMSTLLDADADMQEEKSKTFLGKIIALSKKDSDALSTVRLVGNLLTMFAAGSETTHVTICSSLHVIANDCTGLQDELAAEALAFENFDTAGLDELTLRFPRIRSLTYEILRIKGPSPFLGLEAKEPLEIDGAVQPPHTLFLIMTRYISTLESSQAAKRTPRGPRDASPADFCARRWLATGASSGSDTVITPTYKSGYRPFGVGMRVCPGRDLAEVEIIVILASILRKFEIALEEGHPPMKFVTRFTESPKTDVRLVLKLRKMI
jgi:cytochrome P450